ncbi:DUF2271 domain-containing protein [Methyloradius palustris]|uniref:DUF2271 domain-containing protein n=1 Tax=Methyloradius palustris TaxID=2778876 RepID=A0A8D5G1C7_9PROT|nr:DUF2271 domain-containing protein [Methyloradius palustris]BCM25580.1 hypothetical protein ZMTM_18390 [Methyloradius palustris]
MRNWVPVLLPSLIAGLFAHQGMAADLNIKVNIPQINASEYHRPYVAVWIERVDQSVAQNLALWYSQKSGPEGSGTKWLADLRQWWRKGGRDAQLPLDGISGATRPVGEYSLSFNDGKALAALPKGEYRLVVEAAREKGGHELVRIPFNWPATKADTQKVDGQQELGAISLDIKP